MPITTVFDRNVIDASLKRITDIDGVSDAQYRIGSNEYVVTTTSGAGGIFRLTTVPKSGGQWHSEEEVAALYAEIAEFVNKWKKK